MSEKSKLVHTNNIPKIPKYNHVQINLHDILETQKSPLSKELLENYTGFIEKGKKHLENIAKEIISQDDNNNKIFIEDSDFVDQDILPGHQYGIITHSINFVHELHNVENRNFLTNQGIDIGNLLQDQIDNTPKKDLLSLVGILHDIGKFQRTFNTNHENKGAEIIKNNNTVRKYLLSYNLTETQITYIIESTAIHYELGKMRDALQRSGLPYTINTTQTDEYKKHFRLLAEKFPHLQIEIGLLPFFDKLATDLHLLPSIKQLPVNIILAVNYLKAIGQTSYPNTDLPTPYYSALYVKDINTVKDKLYEKLKTISGPNKQSLYNTWLERNTKTDATMFLHHSTIQFKSRSFHGIALGANKTIPITGIAYDNYGWALVVDHKLGSIESKYTDIHNITHIKHIPHITMSISKEITQGASYSKELLVKSFLENTIIPFDEPLYIDTTMGFTSSAKEDFTSRTQINCNTS